MSNQNGAQVEASDYLPFGGMRVHSGTVVTDYKFTDQELDASTNLYNYDARMYDPLIGRFISPDSIVPDWFDPQSLNRYSYCLNNPLIYVDPTGHYANDPGLDKPDSGLKENKGEAKSEEDSNDGFEVASFVRSPELEKLEKQWQDLKKEQLELMFELGFTYMLGPVLGIPRTPIGPGKPSVTNPGTGTTSNTITPTTKQINKFSKQLREHGIKSLERSQKSIQNRVETHKAAIEQYSKAGGRTSSLEREMRNWERELEAIKQVLGK